MGLCMTACQAPRVKALMLNFTVVCLASEHFGLFGKVCIIVLKEGSFRYYVYSWSVFAAALFSLILTGVNLMFFLLKC